MKHRIAYLVSALLILASIGFGLVHPKSVVAAAPKPEQYALTFDPAQQAALDSCMRNDKCDRAASTSDLYNIILAVQGGVYGSSNIQLNYEPNVDSGVMGADQFAFTGNYNCSVAGGDNYSISLLMTIDMASLEQPSYPAKIFVDNIRNTTTGSDDSGTATGSNGNQIDVPISYANIANGLPGSPDTALPGSCLPKNYNAPSGGDTFTGSNYVNVANYSKMSPRAQKAWPLLANPTFPTASGSSSSSAGLSCNTGITGLNLSTILNIFNPLNWLFCGIVQGAAGIVNQLDGAIMGLLAIGTNGHTSTDNPTYIFADNGYCSPVASGNGECASYYNAWHAFELLALGILAIISLLVIIAQALGMEILDAYTMRKMLPRVVAGAIIVSISWPLMRFFVVLSNDLGYGIQYLLYSPFSGIKDSINTTNVLDQLGLAIGGIAIGFFGLLTFLGMAAISVIVAFLVLVLRQIGVILLIVLAPVAIICYALPNTQRVYRFWWESFSKLLLMFPLIVAMITVGHIFSALSSQASTSAPIDNLIAVIAYFAPYFMIPLTFRFSGAMMSTVGGAINNRARGGYAFLGKKRQEHTKQRLSKARDGNLWNKDFGRFDYSNTRAGKAYNRAHKGLFGKDRQLKGSVGKMGNRGAAWTFDADQLVPYQLGKERSGKYGKFGGLVGTKRYSAGLGGRIADAVVEQTGKRAQTLSAIHYKGQRALGGDFEYLSMDTQKRLADSGWGSLRMNADGSGPVVTKNALGDNTFVWDSKKHMDENLTDADSLSNILLQSSDDKERLGGKNIRENRGAIATFSNPEEFRYADLQSAALLNLAQAGRAEQLAVNANDIQGRLGPEAGSRIYKALADTNSKIRGESRFGYGTVVETMPDGTTRYVDALSQEIDPNTGQPYAAGSTAKTQITSAGYQMNAQNKGEGIQRQAPAYLAQLARGPQGQEYIDAQGNKQRQWSGEQLGLLNSIQTGTTSYGGDPGEQAAWHNIRDQLKASLDAQGIPMPSGGGSGVNPMIALNDAAARDAAAAAEAEAAAQDNPAGQ